MPHPIILGQTTLGLPGLLRRQKCEYIFRKSFLGIPAKILWCDCHQWIMITDNCRDRTLGKIEKNK